MDSLLQQLVRYSPHGIVVLDHHRCVRLVNPAAYSLITLVGDPIGLPIEQAIPIVELIAHVQGPPNTKEIVHGSRELKIQVIPLPSADPQDPDGFLIQLEDITESKRIERAQREFVANVSHELRTPTTSINGFAQMLLDDAETLSAEHQMMVGAIHRNADRLHTLFEDLLMLSKLEADDSPLEEESLSLLGIVQECVDKQSVRAESKGILCHVLVSDRLLVISNRDALIHIIGNLVENAVKYGYDNSIVTVRAALRDGMVQLEVIDLGVGIAPAHQKRIFERFFRVDKGRSRKVGGTGLGLAIVQRLLDRTGIQLELRSQVDKGSIFRIYLTPDLSMQTV